MIQIVCTKHLTTGGAELLHQLCYELNSLQIDSNMAYYLRRDDTFISTEINENYAKYCKYDKTFDLIDVKENTIVFPETMSYLAKKVKNAKVVIWWLSIDNYLINFNYDHYKNNGFRPTVNELKKIGRRPSFDKLSKYFHISQSHYAQEYLKSNGISSLIVSDYLNTEFTQKEVAFDQKENVVCYNPKKGIEVSKKIISYFKSKSANVSFVPIIGLNSEGVKKLMGKSKIYIDFGGHPGKDRMPREARIQDCVIVTGKRGSANNIYDVLINDSYKLNEKDLDFLNILDNLIFDVMDRFEFHLNEQKTYRLQIIDEKNQFTTQVKEFIKILSEVNE